VQLLERGCLAVCTYNTLGGVDMQATRLAVCCGARFCSRWHMLVWLLGWHMLVWLSLAHAGLAVAGTCWSGCRWHALVWLLGWVGLPTAPNTPCGCACYAPRAVRCRQQAAGSVQLLGQSMHAATIVLCVAAQALAAQGSSGCMCVSLLQIDTLAYGLLSRWLHMETVVACASACCNMILWRMACSGADCTWKQWLHVRQPAAT